MIHPQQPIKVLLVDDDEDDFILTEDLLMESAKVPFEVTWASNYTQAIEKAKEINFDIFLVDFRLGKHSGLELLSELRKYYPHHPVILLTGQGGDQIDKEAMEAGATDYLVKSSFDGPLLERTLRYSYENSRKTMEIIAHQKQYSSLFEKSLDPIFLANADFQIEDVNEAFENLFGSLAGEDFEKLFKSPEGFKKLKSDFLTNEIVKDTEVRLKVNHGKSLVCQITLVEIPSTLSGKNIIQGIIKDVTAIKKAREHLIKADKLALTGRMARSIAHEVRNPLTNIHLSLEQLKEECEENGWEGLDVYIGIMERNAVRINTLITDLMNSAKSAPLQLKYYKLGEVIEQTLLLSKDRFELRGVELVTKIHDPNFEFKIDPEKLKTALLNIIINGIELVPEEGGKIIVRTSQSESELKISITDNGPGISPENVGKLFDPFFTGRQGGMGLGLTTSQSIITAHNADVEVETELGKGTTFHIIFPL